MDKKQLIIFIAAMAFLGFRLYQKYIKKDKTKAGTDIKPSADSSFSSNSKDDDYEPYQKK
jgi:hypothetical protein